MSQVSAKFQEYFHHAPSLLVNSPGRINLIGEHIDYNDGFVLPASINKSIEIAISANTENDVCTLLATDFGQSFQFRLHTLEHSTLGWPDYVLGVIQQIQLLGGALQPFQCAFGGNIPTGAGLSSSAALECGVAFALNELFGLGLSRLQIVQLSKLAENQFVGVNCGIMDQFASTFGKANSVIKLDCQSLDYQYVPFLAPNYDIVLCDTAVKHSLGSSAYNTRRQECDNAYALLKEKFPAIQSYRDVTLSQVEAVKDLLPADTIKRATYVVQEIARVQLACELLAKDDIEGFGQLMFATHDGLSKLFEVSCDELDFLKAYAVQSNLSDGSRMMGGGFGGCTINLIKKQNTQQFIQEISAAYEAQYNIPLNSYVVAITDGTSIIS